MALIETQTPLFDREQLTNRITELIQNKDNNERFKNLTFFNRTAMVNTDEDEVLPNKAFESAVYVADIVAKDSEAQVTEGQSRFLSKHRSIPSIKIGKILSMASLQVLAKREPNETDISNARKVIDDAAADLALGIANTVNYLCCAMELDGIIYNRAGIKIKPYFDKPSRLLQKTNWIEPVNDILNLKELAKTEHGIIYNRVTMSTKAVKGLIESDEFIAQAGDLTKAFEDSDSFEDLISEIKFHFKDMSKMTLEIEDATFRFRLPNGESEAQRYLPGNRVILSNSNNDNNPAIADFANTVVTESIVSALLNPSEKNKPRFGPYAYLTGNVDLNPPELRFWAVMRGFPRLHDKSAFAVMKILREDYY